MKEIITLFLMILFSISIFSEVIIINKDNFESQLKSHENSKLLLVFYS